MSPVRTRRTFKRIQAIRIESERASKRRARFKKISSIFSKTLNLILLLLAAVLVSFVWQQRIAAPYLSAGRAVGGDYFNALTFAEFFARHLPFPPTGWMPFWNAGVPVVGGYPSAFFYAMIPLTRFFDVPTSMELLSIVLLLPFFILSHFLFWEVTRNHILSLFFTGILIVTPAVYYALTAEGLIIASAMQWLLPATLFLLVRFTKFQQPFLLVAAGITSGLALLIHPAMTLVTTLVPAFLYLAIADTGDPKDSAHTQQLRLIRLSRWTNIATKAKHLLLYLTVSVSVGSIGVYALTLSMFFSGGAGACESPQCWGAYPEHFIWFSPLLILPPAVFVPFSLLAWRLRKARFSEVIAPGVSLAVALTYITAARLQLIDNLASAIFPRRIFWATTLFILFLSASCLRYISKASARLVMTALALIIIALVPFIPSLPRTLTFSLDQYLKVPNVLPMGVDTYIVSKYQSLPISDILPPWLPIDEDNWRIDSIRPDFFVWWNTVSRMPSTRGYSNAPTRPHLDWIYYLQTATLASSDGEIGEETRLNRALFLLDAFAVKLIFEAGNPYERLLLDHPSVVTRSQKIREWIYYQLDERWSSPIVSPTNGSRVLVVSDDPGYATLMRALSLVNLHSKRVIPIKGPASINKLSNQLLSGQDAVVLYRFSGMKWDALEQYVRGGGQLYIETGSLENLPTEVPPLFGSQGLQEHLEEGTWNLSQGSSPLLTGVQTNKFAPLRFQNDPWKIIAPPSTTYLADWMHPILTHNGIPILSQGTFGKGKVILTGFNLPYHIVSFTSGEEAVLLKNIVSELTAEPRPITEFAVSRPKPSSIYATTKQAKGLYFKENYHSGWRAKVNGVPTPVYRAGLDFMYVPLPQGKQEAAQVELSFRGNIETWVFPMLSAASLTLAGLYALTASPFRVMRKFLVKRMTKPLRSWWAKE